MSVRRLRPEFRTNENRVRLFTRLLVPICTIIAFCWKTIPDIIHWTITCVMISFDLYTYCGILGWFCSKSHASLYFTSMMITRVWRNETQFILLNHSNVVYLRNLIIIKEMMISNKFYGVLLLSLHIFRSISSGLLMTNNLFFLVFYLKR